MLLAANCRMTLYSSPATAFKDGQTEILKFRNTGDSYEVLKMPNWTEPYSLDVKSEVRGKVEDLKVKIQPTKP